MDPISVSLGLLLGLIIGVLFARVYWRQTAGVPQEQYNELSRQLAQFTERCKNLDEDRSRLQRQCDEERARALELSHAVSGNERLLEGAQETAKRVTAEKALLETELKQYRARELELTQKLSIIESRHEALSGQLQSQKSYVEELKSQTKLEFENLANKILEEKSKSLSDQSKDSLRSLLDPFREKIKGFEEKVEKVYNDEAKERHTLKAEVAKLIELNGKMTQETANLTQALKGDSKVQGDWGEYILENILTSAGLREGIEYSKQSQREGEDGQKYKPDIILNLPDGKHLIIDCKVSLKAYESYCSCTDEATRTKMLRAHIDSTYNHIDGLSKKHYAKLKEIKSPDFVFVFVPIEGAYLLAHQHDADLAQNAWKQNIAVVTSTTLFTTLRTVASLWKIDRQNKNVQKIAAEAGFLYDKFVGFIEDFERVAKHLEAAQEAYDESVKKVKGKGGIFRKIEVLEKLGATPKKKLSSESSGLEDESDEETEKSIAVDQPELTFNELDLPLKG